MGILQLIHKPKIIKINNIINGKEVASSDGSIFSIKSPFEEYKEKYEIVLPNSTVTDVETAIRSAADSFKVCQSIPLYKRMELLNKTSDKFLIGRKLLEFMSVLDGMPISLQEYKVEETRKLLKRIAYTAHKQLNKLYKGDDERLSKRVAGIFIPPNEPREWAFFVGSLVMAGIPAVIKPSSRNPIIGIKLLRTLFDNGYPSNALNIINFDTETRPELGHHLMSNVDIRLLMGSISSAESLVQNNNRKLTQVYGADNSRVIIDEYANISLALECIKEGSHWPHSCLSPKNIYVVGKKNYDVIIPDLINFYSKLHNSRGNILSRKTKLGLIQKKNLSGFADILEHSYIHSEVELHYPKEWAEFNSDMGKPVLVRAYYNPDHPLMTSPLPVYFVAVHLVSSLDEAIEHANRSTDHFKNADKSMAISIYSNRVGLSIRKNTIIMPDGNRKIIKAYDVHLNNHTTDVKGAIHQGVDLIGLLRSPINN